MQRTRMRLAPLRLMWLQPSWFGEKLFLSDAFGDRQGESSNTDAVFVPLSVCP